MLQDLGTPVCNRRPEPEVQRYSAMRVAMLDCCFELSIQPFVLMLTYEASQMATTIDWDKNDGAGSRRCLPRSARANWCPVLLSLLLLFNPKEFAVRSSSWSARTRQQSGQATLLA